MANDITANDIGAAANETVANVKNVADRTKTSAENVINSAKSEGRSAVRNVKADAENEISSIREDIEDFIATLPGLQNIDLADAKEKLVAKLSEARRTASNSASSLRSRLSSGTAAGDEYVRQHPWQTVAVAGVVGFLLGYLASGDD